MRLCSSSTSIIEDRESLSAFEYFDHTRPAIVAEQRDTEIRLQLGDETAKKTPVVSRNHFGPIPQTEQQAREQVSTKCGILSMGRAYGKTPSTLLQQWSILE